MQLHLSFFFSSRRRHTRWNCDWSSDVCSSDLAVALLDRTTGVVPAHVGLVGWSLGGGVAVRVAETDRAVHAVAAFSTGLYGGPAGVPPLPPLPLPSGGTTGAVPLQWAVALHRAG